MNRLYAAETNPSVTGTTADHRLALRPSAIHDLARGLAAEIAGEPLPRPREPWTVDQAAGCARRPRIFAGGRRERGPRGRGAAPFVHALAHAMNHVLGNAGRTVDYTDPVETEPIDHLESLRELANEMREGRVDALLILGGNPAYTAPARFGFAEALARVPFRAHLGLEEDETSAACRWHLPRGPSPRVLGGSARVRRDGLDRPASDPAAVRRPNRGGDSFGSPRPPAPSPPTTPCGAALARPFLAGRIRRRLGAGR